MGGAVFGAMSGGLAGFALSGAAGGSAAGFIEGFAATGTWNGAFRGALYGGIAGAGFGIAAYGAVRGIGYIGAALRNARLRYANSTRIGSVRPTDIKQVTLAQRIEGVAERGFEYAVDNPRKAGLSRMQLGKDAEVQATRWLRRWAERNDVPLGPNGCSFKYEVPIQYLM